jgi:hypothetical protein
LLQNGANLRYALRILIADLPSVRNVAQVSENERKNSFLNYETAALPAELRRRGAGKTLHRGKAIATAPEPRAHDRAAACDRT